MRVTSERYYYCRFEGTETGYLLLTDFMVDPDTTSVAEGLDQVFLAVANSTAMVIDVGGKHGITGVILTDWLCSLRRTFAPIEFWLGPGTPNMGPASQAQSPCTWNPAMSPPDTADPSMSLRVEQPLATPRDSH